MELRRALLLFAIVLGLAAIASSIAGPPDDGEDTGTDPGPGAGGRQGTGPSAAPRAGPPELEPATVRFEADARPAARELRVGRPATVVVAVEAPAQVEIPTLGLNRFAEPLTPARFDVLESEPGEHEIVVRPAEPDAGRTTVGTLEVVAAP